MAVPFALVGGYAIASIPFAYGVGRLSDGPDLRAKGSGGQHRAAGFGTRTAAVAGRVKATLAVADRS
jgi:glycerol-3-phosphate acyltransferase PlsY